MLFPERFNFNNNLFDDFFTDPVFNMTTTNRMSTDIKEINLIFMVQYEGTTLPFVVLQYNQFSSI